MKKYLLLAAVLLQATFLFGQGSNWGGWITHDCYKGIKFKIVNWGKVAGPGYDNYWGLIFQNTYSQPVSFAYHLSVGGENPPTQYNYSVTYKIKSGGIYNNDGNKETALLFKSNSENYVIYIKDVCLGDCKGNYIDCQGITQKINVSSTSPQSNSSQSNTNSNTTSQTTKPQNDLTEYYRSKAEMEQKIAEENRRRQEEATKIANQRQQFINVYNEGVVLGNTGKYSEAAAKYQQAIGLAVNDTDRQTAQNAYNKITKAANQTQAIQQIGQATSDFFIALQKQKEEKRERERLEAEKRERERAEKERAEQQATSIMEDNWQWAQKIAEKGDYNQTIKMMLPYANANKINGMALNTIGFWYWKQKDYTNAMKWYQASASQNYGNGIYNIGILYKNGQGVEKNKAEALNWFNKACKAGYNDACSVAENMKNELKTDLVNFDIKAYIDYIVLQGIKAGLKFNDLTGGSCITEVYGSNIKSSTATFLKGTAKIYFTVSVSTGAHYAKSLSVTYEDENLKNDLSIINLSKIIGDYQLGKNVKNSGNNKIIEHAYYTEKVNLVENVAPLVTPVTAFKGSNYRGFDKETTISNDNTMEAYLHNVGVSCTDDGKIKWYEKAVEAGNIESLLQLEWLYKQKKMYEKAFEYFAKYTDKNTDAKKIEQIAEQSFGLTQYGTSEERSYYFLKVQKLADIGNASAIYYMAQIYQGGFGTQKDYGKAVDWYNKSAENNNATAMCAMSKLYDTGGYGLEKNKKLSKEWRKKSVAAGGNCK